jgi:hypothetical protein
LPGPEAAFLPGRARGIQIPASLTGVGSRYSPMAHLARPGR